MITIAIADDQPQVRLALRHLIELDDDFTLLGEAENGAQAIDLVRRTHPNLLVLDYRMPGMNGVEAAREVSSSSPETTIVMLTADEDPALLQQAEEAGVDRFVVKTTSPRQLLDKLRATMAPSSGAISVVIEDPDPARGRRPAS